jgi:hypothetical protein
MKKPILVLLAVLSLLSLGQAMAQTPPAAAPVSDADAQFLATLAGGQTQTPSDLVPAPSFMSGCTDSSQCPTGQLCCWVCGNPPAEGDDSFCRACVTPYRGRCPMVV